MAYQLLAKVIVCDVSRMALYSHSLPFRTEEQMLYTQRQLPWNATCRTCRLEFNGQRPCLRRASYYHQS
jgi:hypothetical protein